ncbi:hypothetical protein J7M28_09225 [bacterium]|nr:hypothetical protein [bacterium]
MHRRLYNRAVLDLRIRPRGPLLVRAGHLKPNASPPLQQNVIAPYGDSMESPYIPGTSLKGMIRTCFERISHTCGIKICDPLSQNSCGSRLASAPQSTATDAEVYSKSLCAACKVFGCSKFAGRFNVRDAQASGDAPPTRQLRGTVAIDRFLGSARPGSLNDYEVVIGGAFNTRIVIENFELWQLAILGFSLFDIDEGYAQLGGLKSKGYGLVSLEFVRCELFFNKRNLPSNRLLGVGSLVNEQDRVDFGYMPEDWLVMRRPATVESASGGGFSGDLEYESIIDVFGLRYTFEAENAIRSLFGALPKALLDYASRGSGASDSRD